MAGRGQRDAELRCRLSKQAVGHLHEDAGTVAGLGVGAEGATMGEVLEGRQAEVDDRMARAAAKLGDKRDPTRIVLVGRVVQTRPLAERCHGVPSRSVGRSFDLAGCHPGRPWPYWVLQDYTETRPRPGRRTARLVPAPARPAPRRSNFAGRQRHLPAGTTSICGVTARSQVCVVLPVAS